MLALACAVFILTSAPQAFAAFAHCTKHPQKSTLRAVTCSLSTRGCLKLRWAFAYAGVSTCLAGRAVYNYQAWGDDSWSHEQEMQKQAFRSFLYFSLLEALPSVLVLAALGEQLHHTSFNRFGSVPWALRVPIYEVVLGAPLGEGSFGVVWAGSWRGRPIALKRLRPFHLPDIEMLRLERMLESEATLMSKLAPHPNVVRFLGLVIDPHAPPALLTELCALGSLHHLLYGASADTDLPGGRRPSDSRLPPLPWPRRLQLALDLARGIEFLHGLSPPMIHRDLKPQNCVLDKFGILKVCDFGLSRLIDCPAIIDDTAADSSTKSAEEEVRSGALTPARGALRASVGPDALEAGCSRPTEASRASSRFTADAVMESSPGGRVRWPWRLTPSPGGEGPRRPLMGDAAPPAAITPRTTEQSTVAHMTVNVGTAQFAAPEVLRLPTEGLEVGAAYSLPADIYSTGMLLWAISTREMPFPGMRGTQVMRAVRQGERPPPPPPPCPDAWCSLVLDCWKHAPEERPSIGSVRRSLEEFKGDCASVTPRSRAGRLTD